MSGTGKRYTIGVFVSGILDEFTKYVCKGVLHEAKAADVNIVVFPGKYLARDLSENRELMYEYQYNTIFSYAKKENVDALIIAAGSIGCFATEKTVAAFLQEQAGIPCVLLASRMKDYVSVVFDNCQGIRQGLEYLIEKKGCRRFAMIGGNGENSDAIERKATFLSVLKEHGIAFAPHMYVEGDFSGRCVRAFSKLLDDNPDVEAVFCVNDDTTMGFYKELKRRGLQPGRDIYVFGYDDTIMAARSKPSLSSVRADSAKLGEEAVRMAVQLAAGGRVTSRVVPTQFVQRDSFSRVWNEERMADAEPMDATAGFEDVFYWYLHEEMQEKMAQLRAAYEKMMGMIFKSFDNCSDYLEECLSVMADIDSFLNIGGVEYADMDKLLAVFENAYRQLRDRQSDERSRFELRNLFSNIYKKIILEMNNQSAVMRQKKEKESYDMKLFVQNMLQFERGCDQSYGALLENLGWLNVKNAAVYLLPQPVLHLFHEKFTVPDTLYLKAVLQEGRVSTVMSDSQRQAVGQIFGNSLVDFGERYERVLLPLFSNETLYGVLLCDMDESLFTNGEFLVNQISCAIKMITLLQTNETIQQQLEDNLATLRAHNIELDMISKSDMLTGILNRRGFYDEAEAMLCAGVGERMLVAYVDMNNLKIINDRYGHEEGDFSLKLIGHFLAQMSQEHGIAGRIGGDEYALLLAYEEKDGGRKKQEELYKKFEQFNAVSDKPYNVTVSAGMYVIEQGSRIGLKEALEYADEKLYLEKQRRKKEVAKEMADGEVKNKNYPQK